MNLLVLVEPQQSISPCTEAPRRVLSPSRALLHAGMGAALLWIGAASGHAQWIGAGTVGGTGDTDFNNTANWTSGTINGDFSGITSATALQLDGGTSITLTGLNVTDTTTGANITLGTGTLASGTTAATINLSANSSGTPTFGTGAINFSNVLGSVVTLGGVDAGLASGSDLILNFTGLATNNQFIQYGAARTGTSTGTPILVINAQLTGTGNKNLTFNFDSNAPAVVLTNNNSTVGSQIANGASLYYTSIANTGIASSLGEGNNISGSNGSMLAYIGSGSQSTNRTIQANVGTGNTIIANYASDNASTLTFTTNMSMNGLGAAGKIAFDASTGNTLVFAGAIGSTAQLQINGSTATTATTTGSFTTVTLNGTVVLSGANTYSAGTTFSGGTLDINNATALGTGALTVSTASTIDNTSGAAITMTSNNALTWSGNLTFGGSNDLNFGTGNVTMNTNRSMTVNAHTLTLGGVISSGANVYSLTKAGAGTLLLGGANTYLGATLVNAGILQVDGSLASASAVTVAANTTGNAVLTGSGTIAGATTVGGGTGTGLSILNAGGVGAVGTLNTAGVTFGTTSELSFELNSTAGTIDLLNVTGTLALGSGTTLLSGADLGSSVLSGGTVLTLAHSSTAITGTFAGLANGSDLAIGGNLFQINYTSTDVTLTEVAAVPEPAAWMLFGIGSFLLAWNWKRRATALA